jgi:hypothetical protein
LDLSTHGRWICAAVRLKIAEFLNCYALLQTYANLIFGSKSPIAAGAEKNAGPNRPFDRNAFDAIERKGFQPKRKYRSLTRWGQMVAMMFATNRLSLRDIEAQFRIKMHRLYHLGLKPAKCSTLADANNSRPCRLF